jgi:mannose-6-phosphate isomerase-like protein (cupin superfamily)
MPPGGDAGLHVHFREDEAMHLLERQLEVTIGEKAFDVKPRATELRGQFTNSSP